MSNDLWVREPLFLPSAWRVLKFELNLPKLRDPLFRGRWSWVGAETLSLLHPTQHDSYLDKQGIKSKTIISESSVPGIFFQIEQAVTWIISPSLSARRKRLKLAKKWHNCSLKR